MAKILLSYRRADTRAVVGRVYDRLAAHYGTDALFLDVDDIPYGSDFRVRIADVMRATDVVVALMGDKWLGKTENGVRILDERDPVRVEIEATFQGGLALVPVLVDGAAMPSAEELPASIAQLSYVNAIALSTGRDFDQHVRRLVAAIDAALGSKAPLAPASQSALSMDLRTPLPYVLAAGLALPFGVALLGAAPPTPAGVAFLTILVELALIAGIALALKMASLGALRRVVAGACAVLAIASVLYLAVFSTFTFVTPATGKHWAKGYVCTSDALLLYKERCPFLRIDDLRGAEYDADRLWTPSSIAVVQATLTGSWFAAFAAIAALCASMVAGLRSVGRVS
jgi:hypothetical protein